MANPVFFPDLETLKQGIEELEESSRVKFVVLNKDKAFGKGKHGLFRSGF